MIFASPSHLNRFKVGFSKEQLNAVTLVLERYFYDAWLGLYKFLNFPEICVDNLLRTLTLVHRGGDRAYEGKTNFLELSKYIQPQPPIIKMLFYSQFVSRH